MADPWPTNARGEIELRIETLRKSSQRHLDEAVRLEAEVAVCYDKAATEAIVANEYADLLGLPSNVFPRRTDA